MTEAFAASDSQRCFRAVLRAFSRPGEIVEIDVGPQVPGLSPAAAAILLTLADATTSVSLPEEARDWLVFHAGARMTAPEEADFVVARSAPKLGLLRNGTDDEPEGGATLILDVAGFHGRQCRLTGPGIETATILFLPVDEEFLTDWERRRSQKLPRGVDVLLCAGRRVIGLPRGVKIEAV